MLYLFPRAAAINYHRLGGLTQNPSGGQKPAWGRGQGCLLLEVLTANLLRASLLAAFWWLLAVLAVPWLDAALSQSPFRSSDGFLPCVCVYSFT